MSDLKEITCLLPERLKRIVETEVMVPGKNGFCKLSEIRIRINRPGNFLCTIIIKRKLLKI